VGNRQRFPESFTGLIFSPFITVSHRFLSLIFSLVMTHPKE